MGKSDGLGDRMKNFYENISRKYLYRKIPVIMRLDGTAFHTFTRGCNKPFDDIIINTMQNTTEFLMENIQGAKIGYVQSDEISILITDYDRIETEAWFDYNIQKMCSISASMASTYFTVQYALFSGENNFGECKFAYFDSRVFNIPKEDMINYFRWRYQDWTRNSMSMLAQSLYSQKELHGKNWQEQGKMCFEKGKNWMELDDVYRNGTLFYYSKKDDKKDLIQTSSINLNSNEECEKIFGEYI